MIKLRSGGPCPPLRPLATEVRSAMSDSDLMVDALSETNADPNEALLLERFTIIVGTGPREETIAF